MNHPYKPLKKINLYNFVRQHLPNYAIYNIIDTLDDSNGNCIEVPCLLIQPNNFKSSTDRYALKVNKITNEAFFIFKDYRRVIGSEIKDISLYDADYYGLFLSKFKHNNIEPMRLANIIKVVTDESYAYKFYNPIDISPFVKHLRSLTTIKYDLDAVSVYFEYDVSGGIIESGEQLKDSAFFEVSRRTLMNDNIELYEMFKLSFPIRNDEVFDVFVINNSGQEELYVLIDDEYILLETEQALKDYANNMFFSAYKKSVHYKFGVNVTEINEDYLTLLSMDNI